MIRLVCFIFFISGASALIFQALWFHLLALTLGNSVWASAVVTASFMAGLGIGNGIVAFKGRTVARPVRAYACLELAIAVTGVVIVLILPQQTHLMAALFHSVTGHDVVLNVIRFAIAFVVLLVPSVAMGATLPLLVKALYAMQVDFGRALGTLYGWNTLGAVAGVLANELVLVELLGLRFTALLAGGFNLLAAALALGVSARKEKAVEPVAPRKVVTSFRAKRLLACGFLSGMAMLGLEVIWFRFMLLFFSAHDTNFTVMLAVVLGGIGVGGLLASWCFRFKLPAERMLLPMLFLNGVLVVLLYGWMGAVLDVSASRNIYMYILKASLFLMFPVSCVSGMVFTVLGKALHEELGDEIRAAGLLTLLNTFGAALGALCGGLVLISCIGVEHSFYLFALVYGVAAAVVGKGEVQGPSRVRPLLQYGAAIAFLAVLLSFPFGRMEVLLGRSIARFEQRGEERIALKEGMVETIQYLRKDFLGKPHYYRLMTNNHSMSGTIARSRRYMKMYVYWPVALHPAPKKALLVCYGCGCTAKALSDTKSLEQISIVDISRDVVEMTEHVFPAPGESPIKDPRVSVFIEDARFFLLTTGTKYDIITGEPPPLTYSGVVNLYTEEYFRLMRDSLADGGIVTYWLPVYQLDADETKSVLRAFRNVFPDCTVWSGADLEWMMVGRKNPGRAVSAEQFGAQWADPVVRKELFTLSLRSPGQLGSLFIADGKRLDEWIGNALPLTDNYPRRISHGFYQDSTPAYRQIMDQEASHTNFMSSPAVAGMWPDSMKAEAEKHFQVRNTIDALLGPNPLEDISLKGFHDSLNNRLLDGFVVYALASDHDAVRIIEEVLPDTVKEGKEIQACEDDVTGLHLAAYFLLKGQRAGRREDRDAYWETAVTYLGLTADLYPANSRLANRLRVMRVYLESLMGRKEQAEKLKAEYIERVPEDKLERDRQMRDLQEWLNKTLSSK